MITIFDALKNTPWWVYACFGFLLAIGIRLLKDQVMHVKRLFILPILFSSLSVYGLISKLNGPFGFIIWLVFLIFGVLLGGKSTHNIKIKADKKKNLIMLPGGPLTLILILLVFGTKYFFAYLYATDPAAKESFLMHVLDMSSSGLINGFFLGRIGSFLLKFKRAQSTDLII